MSSTRMLTVPVMEFIAVSIILLLAFNLTAIQYAHADTSGVPNQPNCGLNGIDHEGSGSPDHVLDENDEYGGRKNEQEKNAQGVCIARKGPQNN